MELAKFSKTQTILTSKVKKQTDVGHILQQSGNRSCRMCSTRSHREQGILRGNTVSLDSKKLSRKTSVSGRESSLAWHKTPQNSVNKEILGKTKDSRINLPPPYSPDLSPSDFFLFPKIKTMLKGRRFEDEDSKRNVTKELFPLHANEFKKCFQQFYDWAQKCVTLKGDYFEEY